MLIELTRGKRAIIDMIDVDLSGRSWHAVPGHSSVSNYTFYAARRKGTRHIIASRDFRTYFGQEVARGRRMRPYRRQRLEQQKIQSETVGPPQKHEK